MAYRVALLLLALALFSSNAIGEEPSRCVLVSNDKGYGTGIILHTNLIVTDFHEIASGSLTKVNTKEATVEKVVPEHDLAYLSVPTPEYAPIRYGVPHVGEVVYYIGNPGPHVCVRVTGRIIQLSENLLWVDMNVLPGSSGSGIYNEAGELVGVVQQLEQIEGFPGFGIGVRSEVVRKFAP